MRESSEVGTRRPNRTHRLVSAVTALGASLALSTGSPSITPAAAPARPAETSRAVRRAGRRHERYSRTR